MTDDERAWIENLIDKLDSDVLSEADWLDPHDRTRPIIAAALREYGEELRGQKERMAPVQGYSAGIPWSMHLRAYDAYCKKYGKQQALIEGNCRGGFGTSELDVFVPGWRDELSEMNRLRTKLADAEAQAAVRDDAFRELLKYLHTIHDDRAVGFSAPMSVEVLEKAQAALADGKDGDA